MKNKRQPKISRFEQGFIYMQAAIIGLLGPEMQKKAFKMGLKASRRAVTDKCPILAKLRKTKN